MANTVQDINELKAAALRDNLDQNQNINGDSLTSAADNWVLAVDPNKPDAPMIEWDNTVEHTFDVVGTYLSVEKDEKDRNKEIPFRITSAEMIKLTGEPLKLIDQTIANFGADGAFKNQLAAELMPLLFHDYKRLRHYRVYNVTSYRRGKAMDLPTRVVLMDRQQCLAFRETSSKVSLVDPSMYPELVDLQTAILECLDDPKGFVIQQKIRKKQQGKHRAGDVVRNTNSTLLDKLKEKQLTAGKSVIQNSKSGKLNI